MIARLSAVGLLCGLASAMVGCASLDRETLSGADNGYEERTGLRKSGKAYRVRGRTYHPLASSKGYREIGVASWYGHESGNRTASGRRFDPSRLTAAHKTLPLFTQVRVTNLENGRSTVLVINDRGPFASGRLIDLSQAAAQRLDMKRKGSSRVLVEALN